MIKFLNTLCSLINCDIFLQDQDIHLFYTMNPEIAKEELLKRLPALSNKKVELERAGGLTNVVYIVKIEG